MSVHAGTSDIRLLMRFFLRVLGKTALVLAVPAVATLGYIVCLRKVGELLPADRIAAMSLLPERILWLTGYYDTARLHKADVARIISPEIVVVGTSRAMQFRAGFFDKLAPGAFYNAGGCCQNVFIAKRAIEELIAKGSTKPKVIILGVEPSWFQSTKSAPSSRRAMFGSFGLPLAARWNAIRDRFSGLVDRVQVLQLAWRDPRFQAAVAERFAPARDSVLGAQLIGVTARATHSGFRNDGSFRYAALIEAQGAPPRDSVEASARALAFDQAMIEEIHQRRELGGRYLDADDFRTFQSIVEEIRAAGVQLIVFVAPLAPSANAYLGRSADTRVFMANFRASVAATCERFSVPFFDAYDGRAVQATDADFYDWLHPSERLIARLMVQMYADPRASRVLQPFGDVNHLVAGIAASRHRWQIYDD